MATLIIFKQSIRKVLEDILGPDHHALSEFYTSEYLIALVCSLVEIPFILVNKIEKLKCAALTGVFGIVLFLFSFIAHYIVISVEGDPDDKPQGGMSAWPDDWFQAFATIPNILLSLTYQQNFYPIFKGMQEASDRKMTIACCLGITLSASFFAVFGILGYNLIGNSVQDNFLESIQFRKTNKVLFTFIYLGFLLSNLATYPLMFFGCRNNCMAIAQVCFPLKPEEKETKRKSKKKDKRLREVEAEVVEAEAAPSSEEDAPPVEKKPKKKRKKSKKKSRKEKKKELQRKTYKQFLMWTVVIYLVIAVVGITAPSIESVFNIVGSISGTSLSILMPCFLYVSLVTRKNKQPNYKFYVAWTLVAIMLPYSFFAIVTKYF